MLDLHHRPLARCVNLVGTLGDDPVAARALVAHKPGFSLVGVGGLRREVHALVALEELGQRGAALGERLLAEVHGAVGKEVEDHQ